MVTVTKSKAPTVTIRVAGQDYDRLQAFAHADGQTIGGVIHRLINERERAAFFAQLEAEDEELFKDPVAWAQYQAELREFDGTLMDGLENEPWEE